MNQYTFPDYIGDLSSKCIPSYALRVALTVVTFIIPSSESGAFTETRIPSHPSINITIIVWGSASPDKKIQCKLGEH